MRRLLLTLPWLVACSSAPGGYGDALEAGPGPAVDSGTPVPDAGTPSTPDSGAPPANDSGAPPRDASSTPDAPAPIDATPPPEAGPDAAPFAPGPWSAVSFGVTRSDLASGDPNVAIVYGGYTATDADSQGWITEMTRVQLAALGVGHMIAVRGPKDADYASREIGNSTLANLLTTLTASSTRLVVVAHSSGGFVADELFTFVTPAVMAKMTYFNLDGGSWALTESMVTTMRGVYFCGAHDSVAGDSENYSSDQSLHATFAASHLFTVDADGSGCNVGAGWCLHDTLIINHPHDPATYDLALDYVDFTGGREVVTSYVDQAVGDGAL